MNNKEIFDAIDKVEASKYNTVWLGVDGKPSEEDRAVAKTVTFDGHTQYFVRYGFGDILDPHGTYRMRMFSDVFKLKKVGKDVFDLYTEYLTTGNYLFYTRARRQIMGV